MSAAWAWRARKHIEGGPKMRAKFMLAALRHPAVSRQFAAAPADSPVGKLLLEWPQTVGMLLWPYQCIAWDAKTRLERIAGHFEAVDKIHGLRLAPDEKLVLLDLAPFSQDVRVIIDRPEWLAREGHLTLSIFKRDFRAFTLSFSLFGYPHPELFIGGLQGRQSDDALALYRDLTKDFEGIRPRDLILELLRLFALKLHVGHIYAIADDHKISHHEYFSGKAAVGLRYDDAWRERAGERVAETHFELPLQGSRRPLEEVSAKKRSMYRRRYEMLAKIEEMLPDDLTLAQRTQFDAT